MKGKIESKYYIGAHSPKGSWASVYTYKPVDPDLRSNKGEIFATISLHGPEEFAAQTAGHLLLDFFHESYFESKAKRSLFALEEACIATGKHLQKLIKNDGSIKEGVELDLTTVAIVRGIAYAVKTAGGVIEVFRDGTNVNISDHLKDPTGEGLLKVGSFVLKPADVLLLTTAQMYDGLSESDRVSLMTSFDLNKAKQIEYGDSDRLAAMLVGYEVDLEELQREAILKEKITADLDQRLEKIRPKNFSEEKPVQAEPEYIWEDERVLEDEEMVSIDDSEYEEVPAGSQEGFATKGKALFATLAGKAQAGFSALKQRFSSTGKRPVMDGVRPRNIKPGGFAATDYSNEPTYKAIGYKIKDALGNAWQLTYDTVWVDWLGMGSQDIYMRGKHSQHYQNRRMGFFIVLALVGLGILYFGFKGMRQNSEENRVIEDYKAAISEAETLVAKVEEQAPIKARASNTDAGKRALFSDLTNAEAKLNTIEKGKDTKIDEDAANMQKRIDAVEDVLNRVIRIGDSAKVVDFAAESPGAVSSDITLAGNFIYVADSTYGTLAKLAYDGSSRVQIATGLNKPKSITTDKNGNIVVLDSDGDKGISTINASSGQIERHTGTSVGRVGGYSAIEFAEVNGSQRLYGIDTNKGQVDFLAKSGSGYSFPEKRFALDSLKGAKDVQVADLKVYVLANYKDGVYRRLGDSDDSPSLTGLNVGENVFGSTGFFVDSLYVYVAEPAKNRILVFKKDTAEMPLIAQIKYNGQANNGFGDIKDVVSDITQKKLFVLDGSSVYVVDLNTLAGFAN